MTCDDSDVNEADRKGTSELVETEVGCSEDSPLNAVDEVEAAMVIFAKSKTVNSPDQDELTSFFCACEWNHLNDDTESLGELARIKSPFGLNVSCAWPSGCRITADMTRVIDWGDEKPQKQSGG